LAGNARLVYETLAQTKQISGEDLRQRLGIDDSDLHGAVIVLSTQLKKATGKSLDAFFQRKRSVENGKAHKLYKRTRAGEKLIREARLS
jgi:hypothetical protein